MIKIYLLDFSGAEADGKHLSALPDFIKNTKNPALRREREFSYMLLFYAYGNFVSDSGAVPSIERDGNGRPYFSGEKIDFNISHDKDFAAVVISDEGRVGIDIQLRSKNVSQRLIDKIFDIYNNEITSDILNEYDSLNAQIEVLQYSEKEGIFKSRTDIFAVEDSADFFSLWTFIEAISKADGRGLSLFSKILSSEKMFSLRHACVKDKNGNFYALCVCKIPNKVTKI